MPDLSDIDEFGIHLDFLHFAPLGTPMSCCTRGLFTRYRAKLV